MLGSIRMPVASIFADLDGYTAGVYGGGITIYWKPLQAPIARRGRTASM